MPRVNSQAVTMSEELPASKLGTKQHWDMVYERETKEYEASRSVRYYQASTRTASAVPTLEADFRDSWLPLHV